MFIMQTPAQILSKRFARKATDKAQKGVTMIELSIVLVVAGLLAAAVFLAFQGNTRRVSVADNTSLITETAAELKKKFGLTGTYASVTTALAVQSRAIPEQLRVPATNTAQNGYGGLITTLPTTLVVANDAVALLWPSVKQNECIDLVINTQNVARRITVGAVVVKPTDGALNLATTATNCELAPSVNVTFDIGRS